MTVEIRESTDVAAARRAGMVLANRAGFDEQQASNLGIVITEAASNVLKHGRGGEMVLCRAHQRIEVFALDKGPGTSGGSRCFEDGYSTAGSPGTGLGSILRLSAYADFYSLPGSGAVLAAHVGGTTRDGTINVPYPGEQVCGDAWSVLRTNGRTRILMVDGLGHGIAASDASRVAVEAAERNAKAEPAALLEAVHSQLRSTRGAAASVADILADGRTVEFCGVGNVVGVIAVNAVTRRQMVSNNGTLGHEARRIQQLRYPVENNSLVVLHSDGLSAGWSFEKYPGLFNRHPSLIAAVLFRDSRRLRDDASIVVVRAGEVRG